MQVKSLEQLTQDYFKLHTRLRVLEQSNKKLVKDVGIVAIGVEGEEAGGIGINIPSGL